MTELVEVEVGDTGIMGVAAGDWLIAGEDGALVVAQDPEAQVTGLENLSQSDIPQLPRIVIVQKIDKPFDGCVPGQIAYTGTGEVFTVAEAIFVKFLEPSRVLWPDEYDAANEPLCYSNDGIEPAVPTEWRVADEPRNGPCAHCPDADWGENGERPRCNYQRNFLGALIHDQALLPGVLTLQGTGLKPAKKELTNLMTKYQMTRTIVMSSLHVVKDQGDWFVPKFENGQAVSYAGVQAMKELRGAQERLLEAGEVAVGAYTGDAAVHEPTGQVQVDTEESLAPKAGNDKPKRKKPATGPRRFPEPEPAPLGPGIEEPPIPDEDSIPF